jgi:hypothetical protein
MLHDEPGDTCVLDMGVKPCKNNGAEKEWKRPWRKNNPM